MISLRKKRNWKRVLTLVLAASMIVGQAPSDGLVKAESREVAKTTSNNEDEANESAKLLSEKSSAGIQTVSPTSTPIKTSEPIPASYQNQYVRVENGVLHCLPEADFDGASAEDVIPNTERDGIKEVYLDNVDGKSLPKKVFANLKNLNAAHIATGMSEGMFEGSGIEEYYRTIGFSVYFETGFDGNIPKDAFKNCNSLWKVEEVGSAKIVNVGAHAFQNALSPRWEKKADGYEREASQFDFRNIESASDGAFEGAFRNVSNTSISFNKLKKAYLNTFKNAFYAINGCTISFDAIENFGDMNAYTAYADVANASGYNNIGGVFDNAFVGAKDSSITFPSLTKLYDNASDGKYVSGDKVAENNFSLFKEFGAGREEQTLLPSKWWVNKTHFYTVSQNVSLNFPALTDISCSFTSSVPEGDKEKAQKSQFYHALQLSKESSLTLPELTAVSPYAFYQVFGGSESGMILAEKMEKVEKCGFYEAYNIPKSLEIKDFSPEWEKDAFRGIWTYSGGETDSLSYKNNSVSFPSLKKVGESAFEKSCFVMEHLPSLQVIGKRSFVESNNNTSYRLKTYMDLSQVESIGNQAFYSCDLQDEVFKTIGSSLTSMGNYVFENAKIDNIDLSGNVRLLVSKGTFKGSSISSFIANNAVAQLGNEIFMDCKNLKSFFTWRSLSMIGEAAFKDSNVEDLDISDSNGITFGKESFFGTPVKQVVADHAGGSYIFNENSFGKTYNLEKVDFSKWSQGSLTIIGAFQNSSLKEFIGIQNNQGAVALAPSAFKNCPELKTVQAYMINLSGPSLFENCTKLESLDIAQGLGNTSALFDRAFYGCKSLKSIDLANVQSLGNETFANCTSLETVDLSKIKSVGKECFYRCKNAIFTGTDNITSVGAGAFAKCGKVNSYSFPLLQKASVCGMFYDTIDSDGYVLISGKKFSTDYERPSFSAGATDIFKKTALVFDTTSDNIPSTITSVCNANKDGYYFTLDEYVTELRIEPKDSDTDCNSLDGIKDHIKVIAITLDGNEKNLSSSDYDIYDIKYDGVAKKISGKVRYELKSTALPSTSNLRGYGEGIYKTMESSFETNSSGIMNEVTNIALSPDHIDLNVGEHQKITADISPKSVFENSVFWTSSDSSVARVGQNGTVVGIKKGQATITCYYRRNMEICGSMSVSVYKDKDVRDANIATTESGDVEIKLDGIITNQFWGPSPYDSSTAPTVCSSVSSPYCFPLILMNKENGIWTATNKDFLEYKIESLDDAIPADFTCERSGTTLTLKADTVSKVPSKIRVTMWNTKTMVGAVQDISISRESDVNVRTMEYIAGKSGKFMELSRNIPKENVWFIRTTALSEGILPEITYHNGVFYYSYDSEMRAMEDGNSDLCYDFTLSCTIDGKPFSQDIHLKDVSFDELPATESCDLYELSGNTITLHKVVSDSSFTSAYPDDYARCKALIGSDDIKNIVIEKDTTKIVSYLFYNLTQDRDRTKPLEAVSIPDSVTELEDNALDNLNAESLRLSKNITKIPKYCFQNANIKHMDLSNLDGKITAIDKYGFAYMNKDIGDTADITLPKFNNVQTIGDYVFYDTLLGYTTVDFSNNEILTDLIGSTADYTIVRESSLGELSFKNCKNLKRIGAIGYGSAIGKVNLEGTALMAMGNVSVSRGHNDTVGFMLDNCYVGTLILPKSIRLMLWESFRNSQMEEIVNEEYIKYAFRVFGDPGNSGKVTCGPNTSRFRNKTYTPVKEWDFSGLKAVPTTVFENGTLSENDGTRFIFPKTWDEYPYQADHLWLKMCNYSYQDQIKDEFQIIDFGNADKLAMANYGDFNDCVEWINESYLSSVEDGTFPLAVKAKRGIASAGDDLYLDGRSGSLAISFIGADTEQYKDFCRYMSSQRQSPLMPLTYLDSEFIDKINVTFEDKLGLTETDAYTVKKFSNLTTDQILSCISVTATYHDGHTEKLDPEKYEIESFVYDKDLTDLDIKVKVYNIPEKYDLNGAVEYLKGAGYLNNDYYKSVILEKEYSVKNIELSDYIYAVNGLKLDKNEVSVYDASNSDNDFKLNAKLSPRKVDVDTVLWKSSNPSVATVDDGGNVTIQGDGETRVTATALDGGYYDVCDLTVQEKVDKVEISGPDNIISGENGQYTAEVTGTSLADKKVTWSVSGNQSTETTVDSAGKLTIGADESALIVKLKATSNYDPTKFAEKDVIVKQRIDSVTVSGTKHAARGTVEIYSAEVTGTTYADKTVTWSLSGNDSQDTTLDNTGKLTIAPNESSDKLTVTAVSNGDPSKKDSVDVTAERITGITIQAKDEMKPEEFQKCMATVATTNDDVVKDKTILWNVIGNNSPDTKIDPDGKLTVGADENADKITVTAVSKADPSISATKDVVIKQFVTDISIRGKDVICPAEESLYIADVMGSKKADKSVTWTVFGNSSDNTVMNEDGKLYCGPDESSDKITVIATSKQNPDVFGEKDVVVTKCSTIPTPMPTGSPVPSNAPMPTLNPENPISNDVVKPTPMPTNTSEEELYNTPKDPDRIPGTIELKIPTITMKKNMGIGKKFQIKLLNQKGAVVKISSSNKRVATINKNGIVKAKKAGKTTVIINMTRGKCRMQYIVKINVKKKVPFNYSLIKYNTKYKNVSVCLYKLLRKGKSYKITMKHLVKKDKVAFSSSNSKVISVDKKGKCTSHKSGKAIITIKMTKGKRVFTYFMVVRATEKGIESNTDYLKVIK